MNLDKPAPVKISNGPLYGPYAYLVGSPRGCFFASRGQGDTEIDDHHLVEDIGITLGQALKKALGNKKSINRYGNFLLPMDEALSYVAIDISGRPYLEYKVKFKPSNSRVLISGF